MQSLNRKVPGRMVDSNPGLIYKSIPTLSCGSKLFLGSVFFLFFVDLGDKTVANPVQKPLIKSQYQSIFLLLFSPSMATVTAASERLRALESLQQTLH